MGPPAEPHSHVTSSPGNSKTGDSNKSKMPGQKRDYRGNAKREPARVPVVARNEYTPMFERFRDELDEHHDRRERVVKASRDITALSKKIIFSLQRVRKIQHDLPGNIQREMQSRLQEVSALLSAIAAEVQGINRYRYARNMSCVEELIEALTFAHYLRSQTLMGYEETVRLVAELSRRAVVAVRADGDDDMDVDNAAADAKAGGSLREGEESEERPAVFVTEDDYLMGVFDLSGEMMRFATTTAALNGKMASSSSTTTTTLTSSLSSASAPAEAEAEAAHDDGAGGGGAQRERTIVIDMQDLGSLFEMLPQQHHKTYQIKLETLRASVGKVERLGYGLTVRGSERPAGWMPDTGDDRPVDDE